jgi:alpha-mannosidase
MNFCSIDKPNVMLTTLKQAENGDGIIVRLIETQGKATTALVTLPHITVAEAMVTNLVEENKGRAVYTEHEIQVDLEAFGITAVRIKTD